MRLHSQKISELQRCLVRYSAEDRSESTSDLNLDPQCGSSRDPKNEDPSAEVSLTFEFLARIPESRDRAQVYADDWVQLTRSTPVSGSQLGN